MRSPSWKPGSCSAVKENLYWYVIFVKLIQSTPYHPIYLMSRSGRGGEYKNSRHKIVMGSQPCQRGIKNQLTLMMETSASIRNVDFQLNIGTADRHRGYHSINATWKFQILHRKKELFLSGIQPRPPSLGPITLLTELSWVILNNEVINFAQPWFPDMFIT